MGPRSGRSSAAMPKLPDWILLSVLPFKIIFYFLKALFLSVVPYRFREKKSLAEDIVLITGGGSGIGQCLALQLAKTGAHIVIWDINEANAELVSQAIRREGGTASAYVCNVADRQQVYAVANRVREDIGHVTVLVNNAGVVNGTSFMDTADEDLTKVMAVNTLAHFWTVKAFLPFMLERNNGHIVTISSVAGYAGLSRLADYCASKAAVISFHETLALEIRSAGKRGIGTTLVCPYLTRTGLFTGARSRLPYLVPILNPEYLAKKIVQAILLEERHLVLPYIMRLLLPVYRILPVEILESSDDLFGAYSCMENFTGSTPVAGADTRTAIC